MARRKTDLERSSYETQLVLRWLIGSTEVVPAALHEQARQAAVKEFGDHATKRKISDRDYNRMVEGSTHLGLKEILRDVVKKHLGDFGENELDARDFTIDDAWDPEFDSLIGGLVGLAIANVDFNVLTESLVAHVKQQAGAKET